MKRRTSFTVLIALLAGSHAARAQSSTERQVMAAQLFDDAERLMAAGHADEACPNYAESYRLDPQLGSLLHLAECYATIGKTATAWTEFRDALGLATSRQDARAPRIQARIAELERVLPRILLEVPADAPADLRIEQDGNPVRRFIWGEPTPVDPGYHRVSASASGRKSWAVSVRVLASASTTRVVIPVLAPLSGDVAVNPETQQANTGTDAAHLTSVDATAAAPQISTRQILGWSGVGVGVVAIGVGIAFEVVRGNKVAEADPLCPPDLGCKDEQEKNRYHSLIGDAKTAAAIGATGLILGGALAAGGVYLLLSGPRENGAQAVLRPVTAPGFVGATLTTGAF